MNWTKKLLVRIFIILYGLSYLLQNSFFVDRKKVYAATNPSTTNLVAVFVDKNIYQGIENNLKRYTINYLQQKIGNSKAVVFPIDTTTMKAHEISQMLENMYFEWLKDESSKLIGVILIGDIPLPVVQNKWFIYPSIFPYVDFEQQEFIYDTNKKFFVYNDNPNGQAEIRHGLIKFDTTAQYNTFFEKVKSYKADPTKFIDKAIWYDDFIGLKKYFIPENTKYYVNNMIFWEDIGYHRYTSLLLDTLKNEHNNDTLAIGDTLNSDMQNVEDTGLQAYGDMIQSRNTEASGVVAQITATMPTLTLQKATKEMLKSYDGLIGSTFLSKIKDNVAWLARRYTNTEGESFDAINGHTDKINQQDNRILGDSDNNIQWLLIQINDYLESGLNAKIEDEKYYLTVPVPVSYLNFAGEEKKKKCIRPTYNYYKNYYFGRDVNFLRTAEDTSIYKGTFQNLTTLSGQNITINTWQSIGWSYKVFSTQIEANRWYDINSAKDELDRYAKYKTNKQELRWLQCTKYLFNREGLNICIKKRVRKPDDSATENKCNINNTDEQWGCETMASFGQRNRWGASPFNLNTIDMTLSYQYTWAKLPIYDIAGSKKISTAQPEASTASWVSKYAALIQQKFGGGDLQYSSDLGFLIQYPYIQGNNLMFTNRYPYGDLKHPVRWINPPKTYAQTDFFSKYNSTTYHTTSANKTVMYNRTPGDCGGQWEIYTYRTLDSRIKNIAPTWDQISDTEFLKFKNDSELEKFYNSVITDISQTKTDIEDKNVAFSWTSINDITWVVANLSNLKQNIITYNNGMQQIIAFNPILLTGYSSTQVTQLANTRSGNNINAPKSLDMKNRIQKVNEGLETLLNYVNTLSINNVLMSFDAIIQYENFKNQKVEILDTWKTDINQNLNYITADVNALKSTFTQARGIYNTLGNLTNNILVLQGQRTAIATLQWWYGCSSSYYKPVCDVLDNLISTLQTNLTDINDKLYKIHSYQNGETDQYGNQITVQPFVEINQEFTAPEIFTEIAQTQTTMNTFDVSTDPDKKEISKGMNLTTADRPIDNIRNITFQGIGWDTVRLNYANLYEVEVYKEVGSKLILKTPTEIREAIKKYLTDKAVEYNTLLEAQKNKRDQYYQSFSSQFNFLGQMDSLANPNTHNYSLLPTDYFVNQLVQYLDTLETTYGKTAIYGTMNSDTNDDKLDLIAKFLYQQNIARPEKLKQDTILADISETQASFDVNQKISNVVHTYLTQNNDQGKFLTPTYNQTWYEVGYINSDGLDYVSAQSVPSFIKQIQTIQSAQVAPTSANKFIEDTTQTNELQQNINTCEGVDTQGTSLIFDLKTFKSPWMKAMKCWAEKVMEKPFSIKIGFDNALGPVFVGTLKEVGTSLENAGTQRTEYGAQRTAPNNDDIINQAEGSNKINLQWYNTYALPTLEKTIISVEDTGTNQLTIGMAQDMGDIKVRMVGTGDNCFGIMRGQSTISTNICTHPAEDFYNPYTDQEIFTIKLNSLKAGSTSLQIQLCVPIASKDICITKPQVIQILPGPVDTIQLTTPDIVMEWSDIPIITTAKDAYGNDIGQTVESYTISVLSGNGEISNGAASNNSIQFDNFHKAGFIYQAPTGLTGNKSATIMIAPTQTDQKILAIQPTKNITAQKKIIVAKGIVKVTQSATTLYETKTENGQELQNNNITKDITFNLPKDEADIQYKDTNEILQIKPENIPSIHISVKDPNGSILNTVANVVTAKWMLTPWIVVENKIIKGNTTNTQTAFRKSNDFVIDNGALDIALYPSFKAGDDTLTINIPWLDPIIIPITVNAGEAKKVLLTLEKSRMDLTDNISSTGKIYVVDTRNNKVTTGTLIKLWVIGAADTNTSEFTYSGGEYTYTITAKKPGGEGYVFAYIKDRSLSDQVPGYERFIIQESILPKEKLNIMYLNLFWTDRGNQRWYFSENDKVVNTITDQSNKLLATTTELVDPAKIKQIEYIISPNGQIQSINGKTSALTIDNKEFVVKMPEIANVSLGTTSDFDIQKLTDSGIANTFKKDANTLLYIPEPTDSVITGNEATKSKININGIDVFDLTQWTMDPALTITADNEMLADMSTYTIALNGKTIGKLMIWSNDSVTANAANIDLQDPITYGKTNIFTEGSTNTQGIGIYVTTSAFIKEGYTSIENSSDSTLGIWFTNDFKNISNFANGEIVGKATLPYGSQFLINFWDPLLERRDKNPEIPTTDFDASIGQTIYADPNKTIFKVLPMDFNNDGLKDLLVVYTDGTVKLLKNYGGTESYKNMQELMIIAEPIKEIKIGDVDGNGYEDILIITNNNKGIVYLNDKWVFAVDGKNICLNINTEPGMINPNPEDFSAINQLFVKDMDQDGKLDIVTNDGFDDIKIFYGGGNNNGANYISSITWACDANRYQRQKDNYKTIKRFWTRVNNSRKVQDESLIHRKWEEVPVEGVTEEVPAEEINTDNYTKDQVMSQVKDFNQNLNGYIAEWAKQLSYIQNPLTTSPAYETTAAENIYYLPISQSNDAVSVYKEYDDMNGKTLRNNDKVVIQTTIVSKKNNNKLTYIDLLKWPRTIAKDSENKITSLVFTSWNTWSITIDRNGPEWYQFVMDNILLNSGQRLSFSYVVTYQQKATVNIDVGDQDLAKANKVKDTYEDIVINSSTDPCQKGRRILFNDKTGNKRTYEEVFDDLQQTIDDYNSWAQSSQTAATNAVLDQLASISSLDDVSNVQGMSESLETRKPINMLTTVDLLTGLFNLWANQGWWININSNFIDSATSKVSKKLDTALQWLCQGFKLGKGGCQWLPVPFNQAFLAPGEYQVFWCVPKLPNPLYIPFKLLNQTLGKWLPIISFPASTIPFVWPPIPAGAGGIFGGTTSQFRLYIAPTLTMGLGIAMCFWPYSLGKAIPKPFSDLGGNCIVFAFWPITKCSKDTTDPTYTGPRTDSYDASMKAAAQQWVCNNPPATHSNTVVFADDVETTATTVSSPFQMVVAWSNENNPPYSTAIPQGNFWGLVAIDQEPITTTSTEWETNLYEWYDLKKWEKIDLKIVGGKTKGLVQCVVNSWMTRQIQYIQNNLTKMTIQLDLPDLTSLTQGFDKIGNLSETYNNITTQEKQGWYIQTGSKRTDKLSKQEINNISQKAGQNPFEAVQQIFNEVPLVNIDSQDINIKIPALTSDDIKKYQNYLTLRLTQAGATLQDRWDLIQSIKKMCAVTEIAGNLNKSEEIAQNIKKLESLQSPTDKDKKDLESLKSLQKQVEACLKITSQESKFITFQENTAGLISSVKENINALERYKEFPTQLYERTHLSDRYLTELSSLVSEFTNSTTYRLNTNANRFSSYVDAIVLLVGTIQTWQAIIDFSVNWSEKCSKCSNDNYGSFSCSLSFLCPKLPIFPIPAFKIPNIYMDMSHIDLGMNIILPKINFVPIKIPLPQLPNLPEPPSVEVNRDILYGLNLNFFENMSLPTIPVIPEPPTLPEPPSFIPSIKIDLPVLPPAPKIPKILPEINGILKVADFIGKIFCIVKWGIGLVGEKSVKAKVEQITQRTWNVPVFDYFNLTTKYQDPPLQWFDYKMDAYATLKFNFDGVYDVFNNIANVTNNIMSQTVEAPVQKAVEQTTNILKNPETLLTGVFSGINPIIPAIVTGILNTNEQINQGINFNWYNSTSSEEESGMMDYATAYAQLKAWLLNFENSTTTDNAMNNKVKTILATIENKSTVLPATKQIQQVENAAQGIIDEKIKENQTMQKEISEYDSFIKKLENNQIALVADKKVSATLTTPLLTIDAPSKNILQSQEDPTKTYLTLNQSMVNGYLKAINTDGAEKLNMSQTTYNKSKKYLETTKEKIDTALLAYTDGPVLAQSICTGCSNTQWENNYSPDISAYVNWVFVDSYSGTEKSAVNTVASTTQVANVQKTYTTDTDLNNDRKNDILQWDTKAIYIKYAQQDSEHLSKWGYTIASHYTTFYSYANEHPWNRLNAWSRYIKSTDQLINNSDEYGYMKINNITIKVRDKNKEAKNFKTDGQSFDTLQLSWKNSKNLGEPVDGYVIKVSNKIDDKDTPSSSRLQNILWMGERPKYIVVLPKDTDYTKWLLTIDDNLIKKRISDQLWNSILAVEYFNPDQDKISVTLKDLPRKRLYTNLATLTITQGDLSNSQQKTLTLYKKTSPRSNQTVAGMQNLGDITAPVGEITLWRNTTAETVSTGNTHEGYINTLYTIKSLWTDNVIVAKMIVQKNGQTIFEKDNNSQTGTIDVSWLFFTWTTQESFDFIAIDQNNNIAKEHVTLNIKIPDIEVIDLKQSGEKTADIIAKISNDLDEGTVIFQRLRNGVRNTISGSNQNGYGGFSLSPKQTIITGGIFTIGNDIGMYDNQGNEIATIDAKTGEIKINQGFENKVKIRLSVATHIPVVELIDTAKNITLFQIVLPIESITDIQMNEGKPDYEQVLLQDEHFGDFNNGYCIKNIKNDCILYTNNAWAIYIPGIYASSLVWEYTFDKIENNTKFIIKDQSGKAIVTLTLKYKPTN